MKHMRFDDHIKDQFSEYSPEVPSHIWENIVAARKERKPKGFWLFGRTAMLLLGLLVVGAGTAWYFSTTGDKTTGITEAERSTQSSNPGQPQQNNIPGNNDISNSPLNSPATVNDPANSSAGPNTVTAVAPKDPSKGSRKIYSPLLSSLLDPSVDNPRGVSDEYKLDIGYQPRKVDQTGNDPLDDQTVQDDLTALPAQGTLLGRLMYGAEKISARDKRQLILPGEQNHTSKTPKCPRINNLAGDEQYLDLYAGPDIVIRSITDTSNTNYLQQRKASEKFSSAYSAGIRYTRVFNNGISLRTGANYSQVNEKFTYQKGGIVQYVYIIDQASGDTIGSYSITGTRYKTSYNRYRTVDVPLQVGYEMGNGRLHANIGAGAMINIYSWQKGDVLDTALNPVNITTGKSSTPYGFKTNVGVSFLGSATLYYKLTTNTGDDKTRLIDRMHLLAEPYFRYSFKPMSKDNLTLTQKNNTAGLRLGVRIDLK